LGLFFIRRFIKSRANRNSQFVPKQQRAESFESLPHEVNLQSNEAPQQFFVSDNRLSTNNLVSTNPIHNVDAGIAEQRIHRNKPTENKPTNLYQTNSVFASSTFKIVPFSALKCNTTSLTQSSANQFLRTQWGKRQVTVFKMANRNLSKQSVKQFTQNIQQMAQAGSAHVVKILGVSEQLPHYAIVMEDLPAGALFELIHSKHPFPWIHRWQLAADIASGILQLHSLGIVHGNLNSGNILLTQDLRAKVSSFVLPITLSLETETSAPTHNQRKFLSPAAWMAPEQFKSHQHITASTDVYSFGMILWELASRKVPFSAVKGNERLIKTRLLSGKKPPIPKDCPKQFRKAISSCWKPTDQRPSMTKLARFFHQCVQQFNDTAAVKTIPYPTQAATTHKNALATSMSRSNKTNQAAAMDQQKRIRTTTTAPPTWDTFLKDAQTAPQTNATSEAFLETTTTAPPEWDTFLKDVPAASQTNTMGMTTIVPSIDTFLQKLMGFSLAKKTVSTGEASTATPSTFSPH